MRSHIVSRVLLKRFARNGRLRVWSKQRGIYELRPLKKVGWIKIPRELIGKEEKRWGRTETATATALEALGQGTLLKSKRHIETIKSLMVLHFVRSHAFLELFNKNEGEHFNEFIEEAKKSHPDEADQIEKGVLELRKQWRSRLVKSIPEQLKKNIQKVEDFIMQHNLEIGEAPEGASFVLSDTPALNISDDGRLGILEGVGITNSVGFVIPLGPKHMAALTVKPQPQTYTKLTVDHMRNANMKAIQGSLHEFYSLT